MRCQRLVEDSSWIDKEGMLASFVPAIAHYFQTICQKAKV